MGKIRVCIRVRCLYCNAFTKTVGPVVIEKVEGKRSRPRYLLEGVCAVCNKKKNKTLNEPQIKLLPAEIREAEYGSVFATSITRNGEALPLLSLIGALLEGSTDKPAAAPTNSGDPEATDKPANSQLASEKPEDAPAGGQLASVGVLNSGNAAVRSSESIPDSEAQACPAEMQWLEQRAVCFLESRGYTVTRNDELLLKSMQRLQGYGFVIAL